MDDPKTYHPRAKDQHSNALAVWPGRLSEVLANHHACCPGGQLEVELTLHASISGNAVGSNLEGRRVAHRIAHTWPAGQVAR